MPARFEKLDPLLTRLEQLLASLGAHVSASARPAVERWRSDAAALRFHLNPPRNAPLLTCVIGGTGTGKSTIVNRLLGVGASATSFRRTYTSGAVAIARKIEDVPDGWLGVEHQPATAERLPARGQIGALIVVPRESISGDAPLADELLSRIVLVDTPDLDGDQPVHHAEADRAFRWAQAIVFLVSPEKYQMTELLPYYRLAMRYAIPTLFLMNKCEEQIVLDDYRVQLRGYGFWTANPADDSDNLKAEDLAAALERRSEQPAMPVFVVPRDDAAYEPRPAENLDSLRKALMQLGMMWSSLKTDASSGLANRAGDLATRLEDKIIVPLRQDRAEADRLMGALRGMETPTAGVDVNPLTAELQRRLQQRSVLYLIGPQRMLDRVRQAPGLIVRLPRVAWDYIRGGDVSAAALSPDGPAREKGAPDYRGILVDQFAVLQSRIDDVLRSSPAAQRWLEADGKSYQAIRITPDQAGKIADEEIAALQDWLQKRWNATPRDTRVLHSLMKHIPGGAKFTKLAETAPYLLIVALVAHHALFGTDLLVLGGYSIATWLTERLSNEVSSHTRTTNTRIADRFGQLAHEQIERFREWIERQAPAQKAIDQLDRAGAELAAAAGIESADRLTDER